MNRRNLLKGTLAAALIAACTKPLLAAVGTTRLTWRLGDDGTWRGWDPDFKNHVAVVVPVAKGGWMGQHINPRLAAGWQTFSEMIRSILLGHWVEKGWSSIELAVADIDARWAKAHAEWVAAGRPRENLQFFDVSFVKTDAGATFRQRAA